MATTTVRFSNPWHDPATLTNYKPGDVATLPAYTAKQLIAVGAAVATAAPVTPTGTVVVVQSWTPATDYKAGQLVLNPSGVLVTAKADFTSGSSYNDANWSAASAAAYVALDAGGRAQVGQLPGVAGRSPVPAARDAHASRVVADLTAWLAWLNGKPGFVGEIGWPCRGTDAPEWSALAETYLRNLDANAAQVWAAVWGTEMGKSDIPFDTNLAAVYEDSKYNRLAIYGHVPAGPNLLGPVGRLTLGSSVLEHHFQARTPNRYGVNIDAGIWGYVGNTIGALTLGRAAPYNPGPTHLLSATDGGVSAELTEYNYGTLVAPPGTLTTPQFLAARGVGVVRLQIRWERIQPVLGAALSATELARVDAAVAAYNAAGIQVILDIHNWGAYFVNDNVGTNANVLGDGTVTQARFVDLWTRMATHYAGMPGVIAYELMNEPANVATPAAWQAISQAAFAAIAAVDTATTVIVATGGGGDYSALTAVAASHPGGPWITGDAHNQVRYTSHHYWDYVQGGNAGYTHSYQQNVVASEKAGFAPFAAPAMRSANLVVPQRRRAGRWYNPRGVPRSSSVQAVGAGVMYLAPFFAERQMSLDGFAVDWTTHPTAGRLRYGVYADDGSGMPVGAPLIDSGLVNANTVANTWQATLLGAPVALPGVDVFWLAMLACNDIAGAPAVLPYSPFFDTVLGGQGNPAVNYYVNGLTTLLPVLAAEPTVITSELWPWIGYRVASFA